MKVLDAIDLRILKHLQSNAKLTNKEIAAAIGMTTTPVFERIKRLEEQGYIRSYVAILDKEKLGFALVPYCNVSLKQHTRSYLENFEKEIKAIPDVVECYHIAGMYDYLLKVTVKDMAAYQDFIVNHLANLENIGTVQSSFVMKEIRENTALPL